MRRCFSSRLEIAFEWRSSMNRNRWRIDADSLFHEREAPLTALELRLMDILKNEYSGRAPDLHSKIFPNRPNVRAEYLALYEACFPLFTAAMIGDERETREASETILTYVSAHAVCQSLTMSEAEKADAWQRVKAAFEAEAESLQLSDNVMNSSRQSQSPDDLDLIYAQLLVEDLSTCHRVFVVSRDLQLADLAVL